MATKLPPEIVDLSEYTESINAAIYADPGVGKTVIAGTAKSLIIATENGTVSAARQGGGEYGSQTWRAKTWRDYLKAVKWVEENCENDDFPFEWVVVDTATQMQQLALQDIVRTRVADPTSKLKNPDKVQLDEYGDMHQRFRTQVQRLNDLPVNVLWTAQAMLVEDENGNPFRLPSIHGGAKKGNEVANWFCAQMHIYGYMTASKIKVKSGDKVKTKMVREIQWIGDEKVRAKDRFACLGEKTRDITLEELTDLIEDSATEDEDDDTTTPATAGK